MLGRIEFGTWNAEVGNLNELYSEIRIRNSEFRWACSSAWLERTPDKREVDGSTPSRPTTRFRILILDLRTTVTLIHNPKSALIVGGCSSVGRAPALHAGGHRFEPVHLHHDQNRWM